MDTTMGQNETVNEDTLAALVEAGSVKSVRIFESANGKYGVIAQSGMTEKTLSSRRESVRMFASLDTLKRYLKDKIGINQFEVIGQ